MIQSCPRLLTLGRMANLLGQPAYRLDYVIRTRRIRPVAVAGIVRLFDKAALARIRYELNLIDAKQGEKL